MRTDRRRTTIIGAVFIVVTVVVAFVVVRLSPDSADDAGDPAPTASQPRYDYDAATREHLMVPTTMDNDADGEPDLVSIDIVRPSEPSTGKVPVILESSPYYFTIGRGAEQQKKVLAADGTVKSMPLFYDNYFVPRGYAFVAMDNPGTGRSTGCMDIWGPEDIGAAIAVVKFLSGEGFAYDNDNQKVTASSWSSGSVGMIGKSYDATVANAVAAAGEPGLKTIVSISGIIDPYAYTRFNGIARYPDYERGYIAEETSRAKQCQKFTDTIPLEADDAGGDYTPFWTARNILDKVPTTKASVLISHGLADWNVLPSQFSQYWTALTAAGVPRKLWLSQSGHIDPFDVRRAQWVKTLHAWFDHWLLGIDNNVMAEPAVDVETKPGTWIQQGSWPSATGSTPLGLGTAGTQSSLSASPATSAPVTIVDDKKAVEKTLVAAPTTMNPARAAFLGDILKVPTRVSGTPTVTVRVKVAAARAQLSFRLVNYGEATRINSNVPDGIVLGDSEECFGQSDPADSACYRRAVVPVSVTPYAVLSRGWIDIAHRDGLAAATPFSPTEWLNITVILTPVDARLTAGQQLGLVVASSDPEMATPYADPATIELDPAESSVSIPLVS